MARKIGSKEDRINRFFRMCLEWQYDRRHKVFRNNSYYFTKYQVGKYNSRYFKDIDTAVIDREYIINKMSFIYSEYDKMREAKRLSNLNNAVNFIEQCQQKH